MVEGKIIYLGNMYFQKHHYIEMVNNQAGQPKTVTDYLFHIALEKEQDKPKNP